MLTELPKEYYLPSKRVDYYISRAFNSVKLQIRSAAGLVGRVRCCHRAGISSGGPGGASPDRSGLVRVLGVVASRAGDALSKKKRPRKTGAVSQSGLRRADFPCQWFRTP